MHRDIPDSPVKFIRGGAHVWIRVECMSGDDETRNFVLLDDNSESRSVFTGKTPRQAAKKAARRLDPAPAEEIAEQKKQTIRLRERGTSKVHVYRAWAWKEEAPDGSPEWLEGEITEANVSKEGTTHID